METVATIVILLIAAIVPVDHAPRDRFGNHIDTRITVFEWPLERRTREELWELAYTVVGAIGKVEQQ
ncbi:MAG: hypothetical protein OXE05_12675 [Chloroflexi bacterium]|nr:hypothetical protein [Chloroflexota bacterium]